MKKGLRQADIKQGQPILNRLQSKSTEDEPNAAGSEPSLRKIVRIVFNLGIHRRANAGDKAGHQSYPDRKRPGVVKTMDKERYKPVPWQCSPRSGRPFPKTGDE